MSTSEQKSPQEIEEALLKQIDFYFSIENLSKDSYLVSKMDPRTSFVPLSLIASFKLVKQLTEDLEILKKVVKKSKNAVLSDDQNSIRPNVEQTSRTTLILRDLEKSVQKKDIEELFSKVLKEDTRPYELVKDIGNTWFCKFHTEEQTLEAFKILGNQQLGGSYFGVRIKTENPLINLLLKNNVKYSPEPSSNTSSSSSPHKTSPSKRSSQQQRSTRKFSRQGKLKNEGVKNTTTISTFPKVKELKSGYTEGVSFKKYRKRDFIEVFDKLFESLEKNENLLKKPKDLGKFGCVIDKPHTSLELTKPVYVKPTVVVSQSKIQHPTPKKKIYVEGGENLVIINERNVILDRPTTPGKKSFAEAAITAKDIKPPKISDKNIVREVSSDIEPLHKSTSTSGKKKKIKFEKKEDSAPVVEGKKGRVKYEKKEMNESSVNEEKFVEKKKKKRVQGSENKENIEKRIVKDQSGKNQSKKKKKKKKEKGVQKFYAKVEEKVESSPTVVKTVTRESNGKTYASIVQQLKKSEGKSEGVVANEVTKNNESEVSLQTTKTTAVKK